MKSWDQDLMDACIITELSLPLTQLETSDKFLFKSNRSNRGHNIQTI